MNEYAYVVSGRDEEVENFLRLLGEKFPHKVVTKEHDPLVGHIGHIITEFAVTIGEIVEFCKTCGSTVFAGFTIAR